MDTHKYTNAHTTCRHAVNINYDSDFEVRLLIICIVIIAIVLRSSVSTESETSSCSGQKLFLQDTRDEESHAPQDS